MGNGTLIKKSNNWHSIWSNFLRYAIKQIIGEADSRWRAGKPETRRDSPFSPEDRNDNISINQTNDQYKQCRVERMAKKTEP